jgi:hypothetical protein
MSNLNINKPNNFDLKSYIFGFISGIGERVPTINEFIVIRTAIESSTSSDNPVNIYLDSLPDKINPTQWETLLKLINVTTLY